MSEIEVSKNQWKPVVSIASVSRNKWIILYVLIAIAIFYIDIHLPLGVAGGVPYVVLVLLGLMSKWRYTVIVLACVSTTLTIVGYYFSPAGGITWMIITNRGLAISIIWATAILAYLQKENAKKYIDISTLYKTTFDQASVGIAHVDLKGRFIRVNKCLQDLIGYQEDELAALTFQEITHPDDLDKDLDFLHKLLEGTINSYRIEKRYIRNDGTISWVNLSVSLVRNVDDIPQYFVAAIQDINNEKIAKDALNESEERLRMAISAAEMGTWRWDIEAKLDTRDANFNHILGLEAAESTQTVEDFVDRIHPDDRATVEEELKRSIREQDIYLAEFRIIRPDGTERWLSDQGLPFYNEQNVISYMTGIIVDITERKQAEKNLQEQHALLTAITEGTTDAIYVKDLEGRYLMINTAGAKIIGKQVGEIIGRNDMELFPLDIAKKVIEIDRKLIESGELSVSELVMPDNEIGFMDEIKGPIRDAKGDIISIFGISRDVTEKKLVESTLKETQHMLQLVLDTIPVAVFWKDTDLCFTGCNLRFAKEVGLNNPEDIVGKSDSDLAVPEHAELYEAINREVLQSGIPKLNALEPYKRPDGIDVWIETNKIPLTDSKGKIIGLLGTFEDITERKKAEVKIRESEEKLRRFYEAGLIGMGIGTAGGQVIEFNDVYCEIVGYLREELTSMNWMDFTHPDDLEAELTLHKQILSGEIDRYTQEKRYIRKDGGIAYVIVSAVCPQGEW